MGVNDTDAVSKKTSTHDDQPQTISKSKISLEMFQEVFANIEPSVIIDSYEEAQGSVRGDNYTAALYRILLKGHRSNIGVDDVKKLKWEQSVMCKRLPDNRAHREAYKSEELFRNEVEFYTTILTELNNFEKSIKTRNAFKAIPKCFLAQNDMLILEDMCARDFKMPNRKAGLCLSETEAVLTEIAKFHSLSLAYKSQHPDKFTKLTNHICEGIFSPDNASWYSNYYRCLSQNALDIIGEQFNAESVYVKNLKIFLTKETFFATMIDLVTKRNDLSVICHGDCWTNNLLFKYDDMKNITETCFVDFQLIRYGSPALDIANLIFCCTDQTLRKKHLNALLKLYHRELVNSLKEFGPMPEFCGTEDELWKKLQLEFKICARFGLGLALDIIPISTCSPEEAPDLYVEHTEEATCAPELNVPPNELCRKKITDIVVDLVDGGLL